MFSQYVGLAYIQAATLLALARIGDPAALPLLQEVEPLLDPYFKKELLPVVIARIQAENRSPNIGQLHGIDWLRSVPCAGER
jgi:hypothetical protein